MRLIGLKLIDSSDAEILHFLSKLRYYGIYDKNQCPQLRAILEQTPQPANKVISNRFYDWAKTIGLRLRAAEKNNHPNLLDLLPVSGVGIRLI